VGIEDVFLKQLKILELEYNNQNLKLMSGLSNTVEKIEEPGDMTIDQ
jgi:hypothetical protein